MNSDKNCYTCDNFGKCGGFTLNECETWSPTRNYLYHQNKILEAEISDLKALLFRHHSIGEIKKIKCGCSCPICAKFYNEREDLNA